ncbi:MAG: hypothetical protein ACE5FU_03230 [Nitrospinota bacterium]
MKRLALFLLTLLCTLPTNAIATQTHTVPFSLRPVLINTTGRDTIKEYYVNQEEQCANNKKTN